MEAQPPTPIKVSVVIPTYNRRESLARTLTTVFAQDFPPKEYEVVVTVDGSTDGTAEFLRQLKPGPALRVIEHPRNLGQSAARNSAIRVAQGEIILFVDDDILCDRSLLKEHVTAHESADALVVSGPTLVAPESPARLTTDRLAMVERNLPVPAAGEISWPESGGAGNLSVPRAMLLACGGFDERLFRMSEDVDLVLRLHKLGARCYFQPGAIVRQIYDKSARQLIDDAAWAGRNLVILCRKEPDYRRYCSLGTMGQGSSLRRWTRELCARSPISPQPLLQPPFLIAQRLRTNRRWRGLGVALLNFRMAIAAYRTAMCEAGSWEALRGEFGIRLPVLLYHHVGPRATPAHPELTVSPERFERQVRWLAARGYTGIGAADWLGWLRDGKALPPKPILLTFDDGYADLAEHALPVLRHYGFSAVVYIITAKVGGTVAWDEPRRQEAYTLMTAGQIRDWAASGIEFGAHTRTHSDLASLHPAQCQEEILGSKDELERITGETPLSFAYPFGSLNETAKAYVRSGFALAMSCDEGVNDLSTDAYQLKRTMVQPHDSIAALAFRASLGWNPLENLRASIRLRTRLRNTLRFARSLKLTV